MSRDVGESMKLEEQIEQCRTPKRSYLAAHANADYRMSEGEHQTYCKTCERWQWDDERCEMYVRDEVLEKRMEKAFNE